MTRRWREANEVDVPYGPRPPGEELPEAPA
jgi:hypothetical protein